MIEIQKLKEEYDALDKEVSRLSARRAQVWKLIKENCTHPKTVKGHHKCPGSYYDRGYTEYYDQCTTCNAKLNVKTLTGYYG